MDKMALQANVTVAKICAEQVAFRVEPQMAVGGHGDPPRLEPPIFAIVNPDVLVIQRGAEHRFRQRPFADRQGAAGLMWTEDACTQSVSVPLSRQWLFSHPDRCR